MARGWDDPWRRFPASTPLPVSDGLATSHRRGAMADTWWSQRFLSVLESYGLGSRLERGRRYARKGQILSLDVSAGMVVAQVQGSRRTPYVVTLAAHATTDRQWKAIEAALRSRVGLAAHLLAGEVPPELEEVFAAAKAPLFPARYRDLGARCTCPDSANPCKHIAATLYVLADRLDADPWLLLAWRGRGREEVLAGLGLSGPLTADEVAPWWPLRPGDPLPADDDGHALAATGPDPVATGPGPTPDRPDAVLGRMEPIEVTAWRQPLAATLTSLYAAVAAGDAGAVADERD